MPTCKTSKTEKKTCDISFVCLFWFTLVVLESMTRRVQLLQFDVQSQFTPSVASEMHQFVATDAETIFRVAQLTRTRRFGVCLPSVGSPPTQRTVYRHSVSEIRFGAACNFIRSTSTAHQISRHVKHWVGYVLENVKTKDAPETRKRPIGVEEGGRVEFHVDLLATSFQETERMGRAQVRHHLLLKTRPRTRTEETVVVPERAG